MQLNLQAYLLWEQAGKPEGAEFGNAAREYIQDYVKNGGTLEELETKLSAPLPPSPPPPVQAANVYIGDSIGMRGRNPLDLVNRSIAPKLTEQTRVKKETPLGPLLQSAAEDEAVCWYRVRC